MPQSGPGGVAGGDWAPQNPGAEFVRLIAQPPSPSPGKFRTGWAATAAAHILTVGSVPAAEQAAKGLIERAAGTGRPLHPGNVGSLGGGFSSQLHAALRCALAARLMPVARLRHRTAIASAGAPSNQDARARMLPSALRSEWSLRLTPQHASGNPVARRTDELLAVACLLVGNSTPIRAATHLTGTMVSSHKVSTLLLELARRPDCADVMRALILLADHLDQHGSPIDYACRRALFITRACFVAPKDRQTLQRRLRSTRTPDVAHARRWIFHTLTGSPPHLAHPDIAPATAAPAPAVQALRWRILPAETELLAHTARTILDEHGIDEPVQWTPTLSSADMCRLQLPGPDPGSITAAQLHRTVPAGDFSIAHVAQALSTTTAHAVYLLSQHPVDWSPPRFRHTQQIATRVGRWRIRYEQDHLSLQDIADREGTSLATVRLALLKNDVPLRPAGSYPGRPRRR